ncbi:MAG: hypothetical protein JNM40_00590 [Myxococcales bacterium]|nr:hypothetical protein [Myxococcales bacterium]
MRDTPFPVDSVCCVHGRHPPSSSWLIFVIALWGLFLRWLIPSTHAAEQAKLLRWLLSDRPMIHVKLQSPDRQSAAVKYVLHVRIAGAPAIDSELAASEATVSTQSLALPSALAQSALQLDIQVAGIDARGCIVEGGSQQWERAAEANRNAAAPSASSAVWIPMKSLSYALCSL